MVSTAILCADTVLHDHDRSQSPGVTRAVANDQELFNPHCSTPPLLSNLINYTVMSSALHACALAAVCCLQGPPKSRTQILRYEFSASTARCRRFAAEACSGVHGIWRTHAHTQSSRVCCLNKFAANPRRITEFLGKPSMCLCSHRELPKRSHGATQSPNSAHTSRHCRPARPAQLGWGRLLPRL